MAMRFHSPLPPRTLAVLMMAAVGLPMTIFLAFEIAGPGSGEVLRTWLGGRDKASSNRVETGKAITLRGGANGGGGADALDDKADAESLADAALRAAILARFGGVIPDAIDGVGGEGIHQAVRIGGAWIPLFAGAGLGLDVGGDPNRVPLFITTGSPPRCRAGDAVAYPFQAIGGAPPYRWEMSLDAPGFRLDPETGLLTGMAAAPFAASLAVTVRDAEGAEDSALYTLAADEGEPLAILTAELPIGAAGVGYSAEISATGGLPPYAWSSPVGLADGFFIDPSSGRLSGISETGLDQEIECRVTDAGGAEATRRLRLVVTSDLDILNPSNLRPASPESPYRLRFEAEGGMPPLTWRLASGSLPIGADGVPWALSPEGDLAGLGTQLEGSHQFVFEVTDSRGATARKEFRLATRRLLTVVPSREKAGLAWSPREVEQAVGARVGGVTITRSGSPDPLAPGAIVYQGTGSNFVDRGLATGRSHTYALFAHPAGGDPVEIGRSTIRILPFTLSRGVPGQSADPHADAVKVFRPLASGGYGAAFLPMNVTGPPSGGGTFAPASQPSEVLSLHARAGVSLADSGGSIVLSFEDNIVELGPGEDFTVFENVFFIGGDPDQRFMEPAIVSVALFDGEWHRFPIDVVPPSGASSTPMTMDPYYYNRGFAGRNATTGGAPTNPASSGGDSFDVDHLGVPGLTWIRYIRIQSTGHRVLRDDFGGDVVEHTDLLGSLSGSGNSGFDLDAVTAIRY
jgi:hypothetical protein